jgi:hypothetical protein
MAAEHTGPSIVFVTADGGVGAVDAPSGRPVLEARLSGEAADFVMVRGAAFDADGFEPAGPPPTAAPPTMNQVLASMAQDPDSRLPDIKMFAISHLAEAPGAEVTKDLLRILDATGSSPQVTARAADALVAREDAAALDLYIEALRVHPDYALDRKPKRLDVFARAVTAMKAKKAIPALVDHLRLPETDRDFVRDIADAVLATEATEAVPAFEDFLMQYRADPAFIHAPGALFAAAEVLVKLGGGASGSVLQFLLDEPKTLDPLRAYLQRALGLQGE